MESLTQWQTGGDMLTINGQHIFVRVLGEGPPMLVLHGFPTASYDYARLAPLLAGHYRLVLFDFLGFGFSDKPQPHTYSLFEQADLAQAVCAHFGLEQVTILTHDMGDSVTLELLRRDLLIAEGRRGDSVSRPEEAQRARLHPGRGKPSPLRIDYEFDRGTVPEIDRVIMLNGSVLLDHYRPLITQRLLLHPVTGPIISGLQLVRRRGFGQQFGSVFAQRPPEPEIDDFWALIQHNGGHRIYHRLIRYLNERLEHQHTWLNALEHHAAPLTVIWGQGDPVAVPRIAQAVLERRPDAAYFPLDDTGHYPQWEAPERVAEIILNA